MAKTPVKDKKPAPPVQQTVDDKRPMLVFGGILVAGLTLLALLWAYIATGVVKATNHVPVEWLTLVGLGVLAGVSILLLRSVIWGAFVLSALFAGKVQNIAAQDQICHMALKLRPVLPGLAIWGAQVILGQMINRYQFKEAIAFGVPQYEYAEKRRPKDQNLASMSAYLGMAFQAQRDAHGSIFWTEKAIERFEKLTEPLNKVGKDAKVPNRQYLDGLQLQLASLYASLGASYSNVGNQGKAKKNLTAAIEQANKVKDSPEKQQLVATVKSQLSKFKHW